MVRVVFALVSLCALLCLPRERADYDAAPAVAWTAAAQSDLAATPPAGSDEEWRHARHELGAPAGSPWTSAALHAALASTLGPASGSVVDTRRQTAPLARSVLPHLRHTPLLI